MRWTFQDFRFEHDANLEEGRRSYLEYLTSPRVKEENNAALPDSDQYHSDPCCILDLEFRDQCLHSGLCFSGAGTGSRSLSTQGAGIWWLAFQEFSDDLVHGGKGHFIRINFIWITPANFKNFSWIKFLRCLRDFSQKEKIQGLVGNTKVVIMIRSRSSILPGNWSR